MIEIPPDTQKSNLNARFNVFACHSSTDPKKNIIKFLDRYEFEIYRQVFWQLGGIQQFMEPEHHCIWSDICGHSKQNTPDGFNLVEQSFKRHRNALSANSNLVLEGINNLDVTNNENQIASNPDFVKKIITFTTDDPQGMVINAERFHKALVLASAGTGKTYSVVQRLLYLAKLNHGNLDHVLVISFSRTARQELRKRVLEGLRNTNQNIGNLPNIRTLDSLTANLLNNQINQGDHQDSIRQLISLFKQGNAGNHITNAILQPYKYLIVDEVQDLVGDRAELVVELVKQLKLVNGDNFGLLLLGDLRQAIYDWQLSHTNNNSDKRTPFWLISQLKECLSTELQSIEFTTSWRFNKESMKHFVEKLKKAMDTTNAEPGERPNLSDLSELLNDTKNISFIDNIFHLDQIINQNPNSKFALLVRTVSEVSALESVLRCSNIRVKPIFAGSGSGYPSWIGKFFLNLNTAILDRSHFNNFYNQCFNGYLNFVPSTEEAWEYFYDFINTINKQNMISEMIINKDEPSELRMAPQSGELWISTVHQAKGREFDTVILHSKKDATLSTPKKDEEARVAFVAATRAKSKIFRTKFGGPNWKLNGIDWAKGAKDGLFPFNNPDWLSWMNNDLLWDMFINKQSLQLQFKNQNDWVLNANNAPNSIKVSKHLNDDIFRYVQEEFGQDIKLNRIYNVRILDLRSRLSPDQTTIYHTPILSTELQL